MKSPALIPLGEWREPILRVDGPLTGDTIVGQRAQLTVMQPGHPHVAVFLDRAALEALVVALVDASREIPGSVAP